MRKILIYVFLLHGPAVTCAGAADQAPVPDFFSLLVRMFSVLALVLGIMLVVFYFLKKFNFKGSGVLGNKRCLEIVETLYVGPKRSIVLMKAGKEFVLLGVSPNQINFLTHIDPTENNTDKEKNLKNGLHDVIKNTEKSHGAEGLSLFAGNPVLCTERQKESSHVRGNFAFGLWPDSKAGLLKPGCLLNGFQKAVKTFFDHTRLQPNGNAGIKREAS